MGSIYHLLPHFNFVVAPIKALCSERFKDWQVKFEPLGLRCCELTGDSQLDDYFELQNAQIIMTTPVMSACSHVFYSRPCSPSRQKYFRLPKQGFI